MGSQLLVLSTQESSEDFLKLLKNEKSSLFHSHVSSSRFSRKKRKLNSSKWNCVLYTPIKLVSNFLCLIFPFEMCLEVIFQEINLIKLGDFMQRKKRKMGKIFVLRGKFWDERKIVWIFKFNWNSRIVEKKHENLI